MLDLTGQTLKGRYRIEALIGRGGMAEVYKAWDRRRQHHVAVKVMREDLAEDVEFLRRFRREAEALARLAHRNIVRFYSFERDDYLAFIVMDYVEGTTLRRRILDTEEQPLPLDEALSIAQQVCAALHYAHGENVLHRDVKPGNIMIRPDGQVLVTDFGIAKAADSATATTVMPGTPAYMSPEQCRSEPLDPRTDVYSLGIVVFEMLAGRRPFVGDTHATTGSTREKIRWEQIHADAPPLRRLNPEVPPGVKAAVLKALAKDPADRWPSVLAFWQALASAAGEHVHTASTAPAPTPVRGAPISIAAPSLAPRPGPEPKPMSAPFSAATPAEAAPDTPPQARAMLPPWAWVLGGVLLAALVIMAIALLSSPPPPTPTTTAVVAAQATTSMPAPTHAPSAIHTIAPTDTNAPLPTDTPLPTETGSPTATDTPLPTDTRTPAATDTPFPTDTDTPMPTETPRPTDTHTPPPTDTPRPTNTPKLWTRSEDGMVMVYVPAGEFLMGNSEDVSGIAAPEHTVYLDGFWIDQTEVTNAQMQLCVQDGHCEPPPNCRWGPAPCPAPDTADHPVVCMSWYGAQEYCAWAGGRLPTEAEWEKAARGTDGREYPWGDAVPTCEHAQFEPCDGTTTAVGSKPEGTSPYGALDMAGNVYEWVADWYDPNYYESSPSLNPQGPAYSPYRVYRGGSWLGFPSNLTCWGRGREDPYVHQCYLGFRCAMNAP